MGRIIRGVSGIAPLVRRWMEWQAKARIALPC